MDKRLATKFLQIIQANLNVNGVQRDTNIIFDKAKSQDAGNLLKLIIVELMK